ncbi:UNVERIFIED_CONTAM: hypothetical protein K2H54_031497 [Gekko kuhli]
MLSQDSSISSNLMRNLVRRNGSKETADKSVSLRILRRESSERKEHPKTLKAVKKKKHPIRKNPKSRRIKMSTNKTAIKENKARQSG